MSDGREVLAISTAKQETRGAGQSARQGATQCGHSDVQTPALDASQDAGQRRQSSVRQDANQVSGQDADQSGRTGQDACLSDRYPKTLALLFIQKPSDSGQEARLKVPSSLRRSTGSCANRSVSRSSFSSAPNLHMPYITTHVPNAPGVSAGCLVLGVYIGQRWPLQR